MCIRSSRSRCSWARPCRSSHFPVLARILTDRGMHRTRIGGIALASAAIDDVLAWSLLAVVAAIASAGGQPLRLVLARCTRA